MIYSGINLGTVKVSNRSSILKLLNDCGAMSRKDIAERLGLTPATVTLICTDLLNAGILREAGEVEGEKRAGRRKVLIDLNYEYRYVLSVCVEVPKTCIAISDLQGNCRGVQYIFTDVDAAPEAFLKRIADESKALMWEQGILKETLLGAGVSVPGPVERGTGVSRYAPRIWDRPVEVGRILQGYLDCPVVVENNIKAFAEGELIYGNGKEQENLFFIKWGPGIGSALIIQGRIYPRLSEIGHFIMEKDGELCRCGRRGCLETKASTRVIAKRLKEACTEKTMPLLYKAVEGDVNRLQGDTISQWFLAEDEGLWRVMDEVIDAVARAAVSAASMFAPDRIIVYGEIFELPGVKERFARFCAGYDPSYGEGYVVKSDLSDRIGYIGPLAAAVNELFLMTGNAEE